MPRLMVCRCGHSHWDDKPCPNCKLRGIDPLEDPEPDVSASLVSTNRVVYIAGPYSGDTRAQVYANVGVANMAGKMLFMRGFVPVIPHRITAFWDYDPRLQHVSHERWLQDFCLPLLERCDAVAMLPKWRESKGAVIEHQHAQATGKDIIYLTMADIVPREVIID